MGVLDAPPGLRSRGAWAATTAYAKNDIVTYNGGVYRALAAFTSGASFVAGNWEQWAPQSGTSVPVLPTVGSLTYDANGNPLTDPDGNTYTWNADGTVHTQTKGGVTRTFSYDASGNLTGVA